MLRALLVVTLLSFSLLVALDGRYLTDNSLTTLPADLFEDLGALEALYIGNNPLTVLPAGLFDGLQSLTRLCV